MFYLFCICIASDTGGFIFGKTFKGPKLIRISPKKTYTGAIGGFILSLIASQESPNSLAIVEQAITFFAKERFIELVLISSASIVRIIEPSLLWWRSVG